MSAATATSTTSTLGARPRPSLLTVLRVEARDELLGVLREPTALFFAARWARGGLPGARHGPPRAAPSTATAAVGPPAWKSWKWRWRRSSGPVSYTHLRAHETD